uniref:Uncharacterized protein n=1 Tax=Cannabis sativa TaxID=3483 RepID=A0A803RC81_CANSA
MKFSSFQLNTYTNSQFTNSKQKNTTKRRRSKLDNYYLLFPIQNKERNKTNYLHSSPPPTSSKTLVDLQTGQVTCEASHVSIQQG